TDDDNLDVAYYFFDDTYLKKHGRLAAFLLHPHWRLPVESSLKGFDPPVPVRRLKTRRTDKGGTYLVVTEECGKLELAELGKRPPVFLPGVRLPELASFLRESRPSKDWPDALALLWAQLPDQGEISDDDLRDALDRVTWFPNTVFNSLDKAVTMERPE